MLIPEQPDSESIQPVLEKLELVMLTTSSAALPTGFGMYWTDWLVSRAQALQSAGLELYVLRRKREQAWWSRVEPC